MNQKALKTLEYNKILELLEGYATSTLGKDLCRNLKPLSNLAEIETMQQETADVPFPLLQEALSPLAV